MHKAPREYGDPISIRWAGAGIAISALILLFTITLYGAVFGAVTASDPVIGVSSVDRAQHLLENWRPLSLIWVAEVMAYLLMTVSSLVLVTEQKGGLPWFPRRAAWSLIGVGAVLQVAMYAFMLGGYPKSMLVAESNPGLLATMNEAALFLFFTSNAAILTGFGAAFGAEVTSELTVSRRVGWVGSFVCFGGALLILGVAGGRVSIVAAAPFALVAHGMMIYLGVGLARTSHLFDKAAVVS
jgi:hypothetical protein